MALRRGIRPARGPETAEARLGRLLRRTGAVMLVEALVRALWPAAALLAAVTGLWLLGVFEALPPPVRQWIPGAAGAVVAGLALRALAGMRWPDMRAVLARLDEGLPERPAEALADALAAGRGDPVAEALWSAHRHRMQARLPARMPRLRPRLARSDRHALRVAALTLLVIGLLFGSPPEGGFGLHAGGDPVAAAGAGSVSSWEGWVEPPRYTGLPRRPLTAEDGDELELPEGTVVVFRLYGAAALAVEEPAGLEADSRALSPSVREARLVLSAPTTVRVSGREGRGWRFLPEPDLPPEIWPDGELSAEADGRFSLPFRASDDWGVIGGRAEISLDLPAVTRRHGLAPEPEPRPPVVLDLPVPFTGDEADFVARLEGQLDRHPWAGLPVRIRLVARDAAGHESAADPLGVTLPGRLFLDPLARALVEERRDLLWSRDNGPRVARLLRALAWHPGRSEPDLRAWLFLRLASRRLEEALGAGPLTVAARNEVAELLWRAALAQEAGGLGDALARLQAAGKALREALAGGADQAEIERLGKAFRQAMQDYLRRLAEAAPRESDGQQASGPSLTPDDLARMMARAEELMREGRAEEAARMLAEIQNLLENLRVRRDAARGRGSGEARPGAEGALGDVLREQEGLADETARALRGGRSGAGGGEEPPEALGPGPDTPEGPGQPQPGELARRQQELARRLEQLAPRLPGDGEAERAAREALEEGARAMDEAARALEDGAFDRALDAQAEAAQALRDGLGALARRRAQGAGQGNEGARRDPSRPGRDPLGREIGQGGAQPGRGELPEGGGLAGQLRALEQELRRRAGERERPADERDYYRRLLDRF